MSKFTQQLIKLNVFATKVFHFFLCNTTQGMNALYYLHHRGLTDQTIHSYMLGFAPRRAIMYKIVARHGFSKSVMKASGLFTTNKHDRRLLTDRFYDRIMIPICNQNHHVIGFSGRTLTNGKFTAKYLDIPENSLFKGRRALFNLAHAEANVRKNGAILCEGFMDVISMQQSGVNNAIASLGTSLAEEQIMAIKGLTDHVTVCYDGDKAGQNGILKAVKKLSKAGIKVNVISLPDPLDPDDYRRNYGEKALKKYVHNNVVSAIDFELGRAGWSVMYNQIQSTRELSYLDKAEHIIAKVSDPADRAKYTLEVANQISVSFDDLLDEINKIRKTA